MRYLPDIFKELLGKIPPNKTLALFIDALDQLLEYENAMKFRHGFQLNFRLT